jgi:deoxycytidylate deaminase
MIEKNIQETLNIADQLAKNSTTCAKTWVGSSLGFIKYDSYIPMYYGSNRSNEYNCRVQIPYKELIMKDPEVRCRDFCKAVHAEEDVIFKSIQQGTINLCDTILVTRYPCERCAKIIVANNIKNVYYTRPFEISLETKSIFEENNINVFHLKDLNIGDENDRN